MNPNKALWEKGDFTRIAESMRESGEALVKGLGITKGLKVLDLGCGDGTTAIPEARAGADVLGVDIAKNLVEAGNKRAKELGLTNCRFQEGDASNLQNLKDQTFDLVVSIFGAMFAPKPFDVAKEMVRVTRPEGRIVMGNWIPNDPTLVAQILKISAAYSPPPPEGFISPMTWGTENNVVERFAGAGVSKENISFVRDTYTFNFPGKPAELVDSFRKYYGPTMNAFEAAEKNGRAGNLQTELEGLFNSQNKSANNNARRVKKMKLLKGDSFPIFLVSDGVSQQSCRGHLSKEVARSSGCRRSVQRFRCSMAVFELLARATGAWVVAAGNGHLVNRSSRIADGVPRRSAAGKPVRMDVAGGWRYQVNQYLMSRVGVLVSLD